MLELSEVGGQRCHAVLQTTLLFLTFLSFLCILHSHSKSLRNLL